MTDKHDKNEDEAYEALREKMSTERWKEKLEFLTQEMKRLKLKEEQKHG